MKRQSIRRLLALILCFLVTGGAVACTADPGAQPGDDTGDGTQPPVDTVPGTDAPETPTDPVDVPTETETEPETEPAPAPALLTPYQTAEALRLSQWAGLPGEAETCGLSDPAHVGMDEAAFASVARHVPDDSSCRTVVNVADYGITPDNPDNSRAFDRMMTDLSDTVGKTKIVFPAGVYRFSNTLRISGRSRTTLCSDKEGEPFTVLMTAWVPGIRISDSSDIQINDMDFDYEVPSAISGKIVSAEGKSVVIRVDDAFDLSDPKYNGGTVNWGSYMEMLLDEETGDYYPDANGNLLYNSTGDHIRNIEAGSWNAETHELTLRFLNGIHKPAEGTTVCVAFTMYENHGIYGENSKNITLESVHLYHTTGMAIGMSHVENITLNRVFLSPRENSPVLMTATADGFHCVSCTGEIVVTNSVFEKSHDDCMNINSRYINIKSVSGGALILESLPVPVSKGDVLEIYSVADLHHVGTVTVSSVAGSVVKGEGITDDMAGCYAANVSECASLTIRNCFFGNKRNRGLLIQVRNVLIENCTFRRFVHDVLMIHSLPGTFGEGIMPQNITVRSCKFLLNRSPDVDVLSWAVSGAKAPGCIRDIVVENNYFYGNNGCSVTLSTAGNALVRNNLFDTVGNAKSAERYDIKVTLSEDVTVENNLALNMAKRYTLVNEKEIARDKTCTNVVVRDNTELS